MHLFAFRSWRGCQEDFLCYWHDVWSADPGHAGLGDRTVSVQHPATTTTVRGSTVSRCRSSPVDDFLAMLDGPPATRCGRRGLPRPVVQGGSGDDPVVVIRARGRCVVTGRLRDGHCAAAVRSVRPRALFARRARGAVLDRISLPPMPPPRPVGAAVDVRSGGRRGRCRRRRRGRPDRPVNNAGIGTVKPRSTTPTRSGSCRRRELTGTFNGIRRGPIMLRRAGLDRRHSPPRSVRPGRGPALAAADRATRTALDGARRRVTVAPGDPDP